MKKEGLVLVTDVKPREFIYPGHLVFVPGVDLPPELKLWEEGFDDWWERYGPSAISVAEENLPLARALALLAWEADKRKDRDKVLELRDGLRTLQYPDSEKRNGKQNWSHILVQMPEDIGGPKKKDIKNILSARYRGKVLEAMCGFNSYLCPAKDREVIALDFCRAALERYLYPERIRILFDLNGVQQKQGIPFLEDEEFDAIVICFGFDYLDHPVWVFREFRRILKPSGCLILVEDPCQGYGDLVKRWFHPKSCLNFLHYAGFEKIKIEILPVIYGKNEASSRKYFLVEAAKG